MKVQIIIVSVFAAVNAGFSQQQGWQGGQGGWAGGAQANQIGYSINHQQSQGWNQGYSGPQHYPVLDKNGVPVETPEVQHAKHQHFQAVQIAKANQGWQQGGGAGWQQGGAGGWQQGGAGWQQGGQQYGGSYGGSYGHAQPLTPSGVPEDTIDVKVARAQHFAAYAQEQAKHSGWQGQSQYGGGASAGWK